MTQKEFGEELVALLKRCDMHDAVQARELLHCVIAILDRNKLTNGLPLTTRPELEGFVRMVFVSLRVKTGNASPPPGGVQA